MLDHNFINPFIAFAIAKLDLAIVCLDSLVSSVRDCTSLSFSAWWLSSANSSCPCWAVIAGMLSLHTATMLDTIVIIWVMFSCKAEIEGVGFRTPESTLWMA